MVARSAACVPRSGTARSKLFRGWAARDIAGLILPNRRSTVASGAHRSCAAVVRGRVSRISPRGVLMRHGLPVVALCFAPFLHSLGANHDGPSWRPGGHLPLANPKPLFTPTARLACQAAGPGGVRIATSCSTVGKPLCSNGLRFISCGWHEACGDRGIDDSVCQ